MNLLAQVPKELGKIGSTDPADKSLGPFGNQALSAIDALTKITGVVSSIIGIITIAAAIWFLFQFLVGGVGWITSGGEKSKLNEARDRITHAFIGLLIVVAGWSILALVGQFLGYNILIDPAEIIGKMGL